MLEVVFLLVCEKRVRARCRARATRAPVGRRERERGIRFVLSRRVFHSSRSLNSASVSTILSRNEGIPIERNRKIGERCDAMRWEISFDENWSLDGIGITHEDVWMISRRISIDLYFTVSFEFLSSDRVINSFERGLMMTRFQKIQGGYRGIRLLWICFVGFFDLVLHEFWTIPYFWKSIMVGDS